MNREIVVDRDKLFKYKLKLTTLSPVHIGTGEVYDPTNYVIDETKLYQFDEVLFYQSLNELDKRAFNKKLSNYMEIIDFYKAKKSEAKAIAHFECSVSKKVEEQYNKQKNKDGTRNKNQLEIQTTFKNPNTHRAVIGGSSIKGMLETALKIYVKPPKPSTEKRQNLIVSDALLLSGGVEIGRADRRHRNPQKQSKEGIYQIIEVIKPQSEFVFSIDSNIELKTLQSMMRAYHEQRADSRYREDVNSFVARVGKNVGKNYVVDDGRNVKNNDGKPLATHFLYNSNRLHDEQFGWVKIELIDDASYLEALVSIKKDEEQFYNNLRVKQSKVKESIQAIKNKIKTERERKEREAKEEAEAKAKKEAEEKAKLASMTPLEKELDILYKSDNNTPNTTLLFNAVKNNQFEKNKKEVLKILKDLMIKEKKWKETSTAKKPEKDKVYKRTLEIMKMLED